MALFSIVQVIGELRKFSHYFTGENSNSYFTLLHTIMFKVKYKHDLHIFDNFIQLFPEDVNIRFSDGESTI